ncbi:MAG: AAA family ATPase, partial [Gammaproteobacteria bacterium]
MEIRIYEELARVVGEKSLQRFSSNVDFQTFSWNRYIEIDLVHLERALVEELLAVIKPYAVKGSAYRGAQSLRDDIQSWLKAFDDPSAVRSRTNQHFSALLIEALAPVSGHRVYRRDAASDVWYAYYVSKVEYHPKYKESHRTIPAHTDMDLAWLEFGGRHAKAVVFQDDDCLGIPVLEALARKGYVVETDELRERYLADTAAFNATVGLIGHQHLARGEARDDCDGNKDSEDRWSRWTRGAVTLDRDGEPARVVVDVFYEGDERRDRDEYFDKWFWRRSEARASRRKAEAGKTASRKTSRQKVDDEADDREFEDVYDREPIIEVPLHPMLAVFDLRRQLRLRVHLGQLTRYEYDPSLGDKLVLPKEERRLVEMLLAHKGGFRDIIKGKGMGAVILCAGPPGTGKTLTAEVYCEVAARPLYSVQCSQLGLHAEALEKALLKVFARAQRWNAILLLDEADVYVAERGTDLEQNAIVGVFLRVLEYYKGVLFLTTNRADLVDDAVASRCIAKIPYGVPVPAQQARIWRV